MHCFGSMWILLGFFLLCSVSDAYTNPTDVVAINNLYIALGSPTLPGWVAARGDPCAEAWQGVQCDIENNIVSIILSGANLGGELGDNLGDFSSINKIQLANNHIGGSIPSNLPVTLQNFFLSSNNFTSTIPSSLSSLSQLSAMSLDYNQLTGEIPDAFQGLPALANLDLSNNKLSGKLPPSMGNSSIVTLHVQNNQLSGTLEVLQYLPRLQDLDVENNQFSGPIPEKLLSIPRFKKDGNLFNSSTAPPGPSPPSPSTRQPPPPPFFGGPTSGQSPPTSTQTPGKQTDAPPQTAESNSKGSSKSSNTKRVAWISISAVSASIICVLAILLLVPTCFRRRRASIWVSRRQEITPYVGEREDSRDYGSLVQPNLREARAPHAAIAWPKEQQQPAPRGAALTPKPHKEEVDVRKLSAIEKSDDHEIDMSRFDIDILPPPPPPSPPRPRPPPPPSSPTPPQLTASLVAKPILTAEATATSSPPKPLPSTSVKSYSIASLQQYTNSFSQENLLGGGMLGNVYRAKLPNGRLFAVKKLDERVCDQQKDDEFLHLVNNLDNIRHANIVELMGYCTEHGQRLLVYEYCNNGTLQDVLHSDDAFKENISWNTRTRMALGAARALEYLHEDCDPPVIHRNFKSANILLDDELAVYVSDCGLAPLVLSGAVSQLSGQLLTTYGYGAPEFESGIYTSKSDVYSFGVVMLELLTGRMSYDRTRPRGEQVLVRWAMPQLHDIDALSRMVDPAIEGRYPVKSVSHFADIISSCIKPEPEFRPSMSEVVQDLIRMIRKESPRRLDDD